MTRTPIVVPSPEHTMVRIRPARRAASRSGQALFHRSTSSPPISSIAGISGDVRAARGERTASRHECEQEPGRPDQRTDQRGDRRRHRCGCRRSRFEPSLRPGGPRGVRPRIRAGYGNRAGRCPHQRSRRPLGCPRRWNRLMPGFGTGRCRVPRPMHRGRCRAGHIYRGMPALEGVERRSGEFAARREAIAGLFGHGARQHRIHGRRQVRAGGGELGHRLGQMPHDHLTGVRRGVRRPAGEDREQRAPQRILIGAVVHRLPGQLLR